MLEDSLLKLRWKLNIFPSVSGGNYFIVHTLNVKGLFLFVVIAVIFLFFFQISIKTFMWTMQTHGVLSPFTWEILFSFCIVRVHILWHTLGEQLVCENKDEMLHYIYSKVIKCRWIWECVLFTLWKVVWKGHCKVAYVSPCSSLHLFCFKYYHPRKSG